MYNTEIDMRCGFERLSYFVKEEMKKEIDYGDMYLFFGKNRKRLKAIIYDGSGLILMTKRLEKKIFMKIFDLENLEISMSELEYILHGSILRKHLPKAI